MIKRLSHATVYVLDQQEAMRFYRNALGFEVRTDMPMGESGLRWLTMSPKSQPDLEIVLAPVAPGPMFSGEAAERMKELVASGALGVGVFETDDSHGDYETAITSGFWRRACGSCDRPPSSSTAPRPSSRTTRATGSA